MKFIGFEREDEALSWAKEKLAISGPVGLCRAMSATDDSGELVFVVVLSNFTAQNCDMHTAAIDGSSWGTPKAIVQMFNDLFAYAFYRLGVKRVTGLLRKSNERAMKFDLHLGFKLEGVMREAFPDGEDLHVYGFLKHEYEAHKWWRKQDD